MRNIWIVQDEYYEQAFAFSNPKKAYDKVIELWKEQDCKMPSYNKFLKDLKTEIHYSNYFTVCYKTQIL